MNFLQAAGRAPPHAGAAAHQAHASTGSGREENQLLPVPVTAAVELDEELVKGIGKRIEEQTGRKVELSSNVDPEVLGGLVLRVGNMVLDASVRNRLEQVRKHVAKAA